VRVAGGRVANLKYEGDTTRQLIKAPAGFDSVRADVGPPEGSFANRVSSGLTPVCVLKQSGDALGSSISWSAWRSHGVVSVKTEGSGSGRKWMSDAMSSSLKPTRTPSRTAHLRGRWHWRCGPSGRPREKRHTLWSTHHHQQVSGPACNAARLAFIPPCNTGPLCCERLFVICTRWLRADSSGRSMQEAGRRRLLQFEQHAEQHRSCLTQCTRGESVRPLISAEVEVPEGAGTFTSAFVRSSPTWVECVLFATFCLQRGRNRTHLLLVRGATCGDTRLSFRIAPGPKC